MHPTLLFSRSAQIHNKPFGERTRPWRLHKYHGRYLLGGFLDSMKIKIVLVDGIIMYPNGKYQECESSGKQNWDQGTEKETNLEFKTDFENCLKIDNIYLSYLSDGRVIRDNYIHRASGFPDADKLKLTEDELLFDGRLLIRPCLCWREGRSLRWQMYGSGDSPQLTSASLYKQCRLRADISRSVAMAGHQITVNAFKVDISSTIEKDTLYIWGAACWALDDDDRSESRRNGLKNRSALKIISKFNIFWIDLGNGFFRSKHKQN